MKAHEFAGKAAELLSGDRQRTHGDKRTNHQNIAALWNAYLSRRPDPTTPLSAREVALMMALLKIARTLAGAHNADDYMDLIGYGAIAGELADQDEEFTTELRLATTCPLEMLT